MTVATTKNDFDVLNSFAGVVAQVAKTKGAEEISHLKTWLAELIEGVDGVVHAPNVYVHLLESVEIVERMRFGSSAVQAPAKAPAVETGIPAGTYTVEMDGSHFTFRIKKQEAGALAGKTIVEYLSGPDNELDFVGFGFMNADGSVKVWKRYANSEAITGKAEVISEVFAEGAGEEAGQAYALVSGRCRRCNRKLTVPASIHAGYGPDCIDKV